MKREVLVLQALEAAKSAQHNLQLIVRNPERMVHKDKFVDGIEYLNSMIKFAEEEIKNARQARRTLNLRTRLKSLVVSIVAHDPQNRKGAGA